MTDFRIESDAVDTEKLEAEIEARIEERRSSGAYSERVEALLADRLPDEEETGTLAPLAQLDYAAERVKCSWEVTTAYPVETERAGLRPFIIFAKRLARLWARIAVGPIQREQTAFNRHSATAIEAVRRQAIDESARSRAAEEDSCALASALIDPAQSEALAAVCADALGGAQKVTVVGPCPPTLLESLGAKAIQPFVVAPGGPWDAPGTPWTSRGPVSFLSQLDEDSMDAILVPETAFWLKPEALAMIARSAYLALSPGGSMLIAVHPFGSGSSESWADRRVVRKALEMAGFKDSRVDEAPAGGGFVAVAVK